MILRLIREISIVIVTLLVCGFLGCLLLRYAPGFGIDEHQFDNHYSDGSSEAFQKAHAKEQNIFQFYGEYIKNAVHGDFGESSSLQQPVGQLIASRTPTTARLLGFGLLAAWLPGLLLGAAAALIPRGAIFIASELLSGFFLCVPAAVLALFLYLVSGPAYLVIAAAIFPRVYSYSRTLLATSAAQTQVVAAAARGVSSATIFFRYIFRPNIAPLAALLGVSITLAFTAAIPVEYVCDVPGLGALAWKAATERDLPLLTAMTLIVAGITLTANTLTGTAK